MKLNLNSIISYTVPLFLMLSQYKILSSINLGFLAFFLLTSLTIVYQKKIKVDFALIAFVAAVIVVNLLSFLVDGAIYNGNTPYIITGVILTVIVFALSRNLDLGIMYKPYLVYALIATSLVILQTIYIKITGNPVTPINILPVSQEAERLWLPEHRASGFFTEPQLYASFIMPLYLLCLLKKQYVFAGIFLIGIFSSGSTYGLIISTSLLLWVLWTEKQIFNAKAIASLFLLSALFLSIIMLTSFFDSAIEKVSRTDITEGIRVSKALFIFLEMEPSDYVLGLRISVENFIRENISSFPWLMPYVITDSHLLGYVTGFFGLIIYYGIFPFLLFIYFLVSRYYKGTPFQKGMIIIIFLHSISATILFNGYYVFFLTLLLCNKEVLLYEQSETK